MIVLNSLNRNNPLTVYRSSNRRRRALLIPWLIFSGLQVKQIYFIGLILITLHICFVELHTIFWILQIIALIGLMFYGIFVWLGEDHPPFLKTLLLLLTPGAGFGKKKLHIFWALAKFFLQSIKCHSKPLLLFHIELTRLFFTALKGYFWCVISSLYLRLGDEHDK